MASLWKKVKNAAIKTKVRGEIALLEREMTAKKKKFGIHLYDLLTNDKNKLLGITAGTLFEGKQKQIKEPFERARDDMNNIQAQKDIRQRDLDVLEVKGAHSLPDTTAEEKMKKAGKHVTDAGTTAKLNTQIALLDREMKIRKEQFGLEVFELTQSSDQNKKSGIKGAMKNALSNVSQQEQEIQRCVDNAKDDVSLIVSKIESKQREINLLDSEMEPLM
mmetsp:Transcript_20401/g.56762  ORF Transcript_20401/g.56762 Transcript_20401/m.56762 type:complete len:219 (-) Transcript_20401:1057-1713(-)|eukprot:CAMPEP_0198122230 /NCGR_PEP_ID=MMETSP1442-20131203/34212_1 /TAXON_ID= /ORGANISM="Craspedostauros australis, Strain CCMP3328" /LENGTH=218 /DNA_ID=CAMNT_0043781203 /DNA_START=3 /DNA_END=659 /DNA_ORIENTATION=+